jgi:hypothetical protein
MTIHITRDSLVSQVGTMAMGRTNTVNATEVKDLVYAFLAACIGDMITFGFRESVFVGITVV